MHVADGRGVVPACNRTFTAVLLKLILRKNISCRLIKINLTVRKLWQVHKAILQTQQFQIACRAVERISVAAGVHADGHIIVAVFVGHIHREDGFACCKVQNNVLPHAGIQILYVTVDIACCSGEFHDRRVAQIVPAPDALHFIAISGF